MKISARNQLKGTIIEVTKGATTAHVRLDVGGMFNPDGEAHVTRGHPRRALVRFG